MMMMKNALITTMTLTAGLALGACASSSKSSGGAAKKEGGGEEKVAEKTEGKQMMGPTGSMFVKQTVSDYDAWKTEFDSHADPRKGMGVVWHSVSRDAEDASVVITHFVGDDLAKMQAFADSEGFDKAMKSAGVTGEPTVWFANDVQIDSPKGEVQEATVSMIVKHEVEDFEAWKAAFDGAEEGRSKSGIVGGSVSRHVDNPNVVVVHMMGSDIEAMKAYAESERFTEAMKASGVKGEPEIWFATDVDVKRY